MSNKVKRTSHPFQYVTSAPYEIQDGSSVMSKENGFLRYCLPHADAGMTFLEGTVRFGNHTKGPFQSWPSTGLWGQTRQSDQEPSPL